MQERLATGKIDLVAACGPEQRETAQGVLKRQHLSVLLRMEAKLAPVIAFPAKRARQESDDVGTFGTCPTHVLPC